MHIWLITVGEPLPCDGRNPRLLRTGILAERLAAAGHQVVWWSSTFNHTAKRHRHKANHTVILRTGVELRLLHGVGYRRNISLLRIINHRQLASNFARWSKVLPPPDVILCSFPPTELARQVTLYGKAQRVPVILDVRDLWPDAIIRVFPPPFRWLATILLKPMTATTHHAFAECTHVIGTSHKYLNWGLNKTQRARSELDRVFPLGYMDIDVDSLDAERAALKLETHGVDKRKIICCFAGVFGVTYDLSTVINAARDALHDPLLCKLQFVLCGDGDLRKRWERQATGLSNIVFPGWIDAAELKHLLSISSVGLAAYAAHAPQGLPNKIFEYMSAGLPVLSSLKGETATLLQDHDCGLTYVAGDKSSFLTQLRLLVGDGSLRRRMGTNARNLFQSQYSSASIYADLIRYLDHISQHHTPIANGLRHHDDDSLLSQAR